LEQAKLQEQLKSSRADNAVLVKEKDELVDKVSGEKNELQKANNAQAEKISLLDVQVHKLNLSLNENHEECAMWRSQAQSLEVSVAFCNDVSARL
jgi:uncharacterized protein (DUF3084 family)